MFRRKADPLDAVLDYWATNDPLTIRDILRSACIFGQTGSGKSSGSGLMLARALVNYPNSGGLILASKPEDKEWWQELPPAPVARTTCSLWNPEGNSAATFLTTK